MDANVAYYETTSKTLVRVVRTEGRIAYLDDSTTAHLRDLYAPAGWCVPSRP